jgi:hypothetical protein
MIILLECSLSIKTYIKTIKTIEIELVCPCCGSKTWKHGKYERTVHTKRVPYRIPILRRKCPKCKKTFSLLPHFIKPWARFDNHVREMAGRWWLSRVPIRHLPMRLTTEKTSIISLKTLYRWLRKMKSSIIEWIYFQRKMLIGRGGEELLELYRHGINSGEELGYFLGLLFNGRIPPIGKLISSINLILPNDNLW